jgi:ElaB/YqjD/DUF883 family membrane-anchored ribosome-binding protein
MKAKVLDKVTDVGAAAAQLGAEVGHKKEAVADAVEDGINAAKRAINRSRRATEDLLDEAQYRVKRHPLNALGISFGVGLGLGALIGILVARNGHRGK